MKRREDKGIWNVHEVWLIHICSRFISMKMEMDDLSFVCMHQGVVDAVVSPGSMKEVNGKMKLSGFAKK